MKKVALLLIVAGAVGIAAFLMIAKYFKEKQVNTRIRDLAGVTLNVSGATRTALDRNFWASIMPPNDVDVPADEYVEGSTFGRAEWFTILQELSAEGGGRMVRATEDFKLIDPPASSRYADFDTAHATWTWWHGVPGEWGERMRMRGVFVYEQQDYRIALLALEGKAETDSAPPANPK